MYDLIYTYDPGNTEAIKELILERFPDTTIHESWDEIHHDRLGVWLEDEQADDFLIFALKEGFGQISLKIQTMSMESKKTQEKLKQLVCNAKLELLQEERCGPQDQNKKSG